MMMMVVMMTALVVESPEGPFDPATRFPACSSPLNNQYSAHALILYTANTFCDIVPANTLHGLSSCTLPILFCAILTTNILQAFSYCTQTILFVSPNALH